MGQVSLYLKVMGAVIRVLFLSLTEPFHFWTGYAQSIVKQTISLGGHDNIKQRYCFTLYQQNGLTAHLL